MVSAYRAYGSRHAKGKMSSLRKKSSNCMRGRGTGITRFGGEPVEKGPLRSSQTETRIKGLRKKNVNLVHKEYNLQPGQLTALEKRGHYIFGEKLKLATRLFWECECSVPPTKADSTRSF